MDKADHITQTINSDSKNLTHDQQMVMNQVFNQLKIIAKNHKFKFKKNELNTTALVNEAWLKLNKNGSLFNDRNHYYAVSSMAMKQILLNEAKKIINQGHQQTLNEEALMVSAHEAHWVLDIEKHLTKLRSFSTRLEKIFIYRYFGGMKINEIAELLESSPRTIDRDWKKAKLMISVSLQE